MNAQSSVEFPGNSRVHIALAVNHLQRAREFYETLLGVTPTKVRPGYVKFEPQDPSVNLTLNEVENRQLDQTFPSHFGIQVKSTNVVEEAISRLTAAGLETSVEQNTTCCYAVQDKVWVSDPDGNRWEVFVVLDADAKQRAGNDSNCCASNSSQSLTTPCC